MGGQTWLSYFLAGLMILTTIYCVGRTVIARRTRRPAEHDVDVVHAMMGVAMAGMLVVGLRTLPADAWAVVFALAAAWYVWQIVPRSRTRLFGDGREQQLAAEHRHHHVPHLAMCCAMVYMLLAAPAIASAARGSGSMGMSATHFPLVALMLALVLVAFVVWDTDRLSRVARIVPAQATATRVEAGLALARARVSAVPGAGVLPATDSPALSADSAPPGAVSGGTLTAGRPVAPRLALCCQIAMGATMAYMLVLML
jgi:Domain of unknown function (DUF5134)